MALGTVLIAGATGSQGGSAALALRARGHHVRALVRDIESDGAYALRKLGIELAAGSYEDAVALRAAVAGADAVFSVQAPPTAEEPDRERIQARALVNAARHAGTRHFVHSSASNPHDEVRWSNYWRSKSDVESLVRQAGFSVHSILRPAFFMENFLPPKADFMFPVCATAGCSPLSSPLPNSG